MTPRRVAVYGGSFDPPHIGHVLSVAWALSAAPVDEVWIIPTWKHAFAKAHRASFEERVTMCELAFSPLRDVALDDVERRLGDVSRTLVTLEALVADHPDVQLRLLVGADVLPTTDQWYRWDEVARIAPPLVVGRDGYPASPHCPIAIPNVSSTDIRRVLSEGLEPVGLVPSAVIEHIRRRNLYASQK
jgi:nicotinate-nucleotide adenylyltransferase